MKFFDELKFAGPEHLDPDYISGYDRKSAFDPSEDIEILRTYGLDKNSTLIDMGAGTGAFALAAAGICSQVIAVDVSPAMVKAIEQKVLQHGVNNVKAVQAGFLTYEHSGESADFIYTRNVLHHLPDFWKAAALERMAKMLKPGGVLRLRDLVFNFDPGEAGQYIEDWLARAADNPRDGWTRDELETHLQTEFSTYTWLLEPMLEKAGFKIEQKYCRPIRAYADYTCRRV